MCSRFLSALALCMAAAAVHAAEPRMLRVCADPDNLPYSNAAGEGFENAIAKVVADELHAELRYEWFPLYRGFVRKTLGEGLCDAFIGVPTGFERVMTTRPYYRSSYVFVSRAASPIASFDDPRLRTAHVGVQLIGNDLAATPAAYALAARGITDNVEGFPMMGERPAAERIVREIAAGRLDAALVWGPQAAYFAARAGVPMRVDLAAPPPEAAGMPFEFSMSMGVKRGNKALRDELDRAIEHRRTDIDVILAQYHVPRTDRR
jgi:quinoprotein dehydrogenase-associated probable ABC transporter substrate-binding protein